MSNGRYKYYTYDKEGRKITVCVSSYAGHPVRGKSICAADDEYDDKAGKALARARCDLAIAQKRAKRASGRYAEAVTNYMKALTFLKDMEDYSCDSNQAVKAAKDFLNLMESRM